MADRALFRRTLTGFVPANDEAQTFHARTKNNEFVELKATKVRNGKYHNLFFKMLELISENSEPHISKKAAELYAKMAAGVGEFEPDSKGGQHFIPGSISFAKMDQQAFEDFVQTAIPPLVGRFMVGTAPEELIKEAMSLAA